MAVVVGPNGSGKSNVADAIVWAAGSLSPSELRAEKPDDVLFAGGPGRAAADHAEVELLFDNEDGEGPVEFSELSIARRLHRGGEGEYLVNRARVRRTDVVELLAEVGLGTELHSVIGQGRVEQILGSKPAERRALVEEAAGLGRFKQRRHRAELKLARVEIQVERARDLEDEVRKRLRPLALQATAAQRAEKLVGEIEARRGRIAAAELERIERRLAEVAERRTEAELERKTRDDKLGGVLDERRRAEEELAEAAGRHEQATAALYRLRSAVERVELRREQAEEVGGGLRADAATPRLPVVGEPTYEGALAAARGWVVAPSDFSRALTRLREAYNEGVDAVLFANEPALAAREKRPGYLSEVALDRHVGFLETLLDGIRKLVAERGQLGQRLLEVFALQDEFLQPSLLAGMFLRRQRVDLAESFAAALEARDLSAELLRLLVGEHAFAFSQHVGANTRSYFLALPLEPRGFNSDRGQALGRLARGPSQLCLPCPKGTQLLAQLSRTASAGVDPGLQRRFEASRGLGRASQEPGSALGCLGQSIQEKGSRRLFRTFH